MFYIIEENSNDLMTRCMTCIRYNIGWFCSCDDMFVSLINVVDSA